MSEKEKKGFTHPTLQALGIPRLRLPGRNWMIFWAVTGSITGCILYDKRERTKNKEYWKSQVEFLAEEKMDPLQMPRKVTVYCAPPPEDYIHRTTTHFKNYIKPILTASATDYELKTASRQGEIRYMVAEEVRDKRRKMLGKVTGEESSSSSDETVAEGELETKVESKLKYDNAGGVICVGRGAYKEYMNGLHEGWFGPLEAPAGKTIEPATTTESVTTEPTTTTTTATTVQSIDQTQAENPASTSASTADSTQSQPAPEKVEEVKFPDEEEDKKDVLGEKKEEESEEDKKPPVPKPYIPIADWAEFPTNKEFAQAAAANQVSDPIAAITFPHILGILKTPTRMYRFFNRRYLADDMGRQTAAVVLASKTRQMTKDDAHLLEQEEHDWANKWKQNCMDKKNEWMLPFLVDPRLAAAVQVYELPEDNVNNNNSSSS